MKHYTSAKYRQRGFISGKFSFLCIALAIGFVVKRELPSTPNVMGQSKTALMAELGQPVHKEQIPRPS